MSDEKVYTPEEIEDSAFPQQVGGVDYATTESGSGEVIGTTKIKDNDIPYKRTAIELISSSLNTKSKKVLGEFELTESGGFQIGKYVNGVTGDIRITPAGITARDNAGINTFVLDATTGSAVFKGTIQAGTLIGGEVIVGNNNVIIDGENKRILIYDDDEIPRILIGYQNGGF